MMLIPSVAYAKGQEEHSKEKSQIHTQVEYKTVKMDDNNNDDNNGNKHNN